MNKCFPTLAIFAFLLLCCAANSADDPPATQRAGVLLTISGKVPHRLELTADALAALPHQNVKVKDKEGKDVLYSGVSAESLLAEAGVALGTGHGRNEALTLCLVVEASDGYKCVFSVSELDEKLASRHVILADHRDGNPLDRSEGPLRLIVPEDSRPARWVRQVIAMRVEKP